MFDEDMRPAKHFLRIRKFKKKLIFVLFWTLTEVWVGSDMDPFLNTSDAETMFFFSFLPLISDCENLPLLVF